MRVGGYQGERSIMTQALEVLCNQFEQTSGRACEAMADVTAAGIPAKSLFSGVEKGEFHVCYLASGYLASRVPSLAVLDVPFHVTDRGRALAALDGAAGRILNVALAQRTELDVLAFWDNGFRHVSNRIRPIRTPGDCQGLTIRTLDSPHYVATLAAMGFTPVVTDVADFRAAIASGRLDAQENPLTNMLNFGIDQHHRHVSLTAHLFGIALLVCNRTWHQSLSSAEKEALASAVARATAVQRRLAASEDAVARQQLAAAHCTVLARTDLDHAGFRRSVEPVQKAIRDAVEPQLWAAYSDL